MKWENQQQRRRRKIFHQNAFRGPSGKKCPFGVSFDRFLVMIETL